ncbi:ABC transporter substrate-binding protein [bacterium]|nr:ABC transporter substrate-binding protein [bacterium]
MLGFRARLFVGFILSLLLISCGNQDRRAGAVSTSSSGSEQGIVDALGRTVQLHGPVERVVTIAPGATEIVVAAGGLHKLVGVSNVDSSPAAVLELPSFSVLPMDFESILALEPDLVLASSQVNDPKHARVFESLGIDVFYLDGSDWEAVFESIKVAGDLLSTREVAEATRDSLSNQISELKSITSAVTMRPRSVFLISEVTSYSFGEGSYVIDLFDWAGLDLASSEIGTPSPKLSDEWMLVEDPTYIFGTFGDDFDPSLLIKHHPTWKNLKAIQSENVFSIPHDLILRPGPGNVQASYIMAQKAHSDLFQQVGN